MRNRLSLGLGVLLGMLLLASGCSAAQRAPAATAISVASTGTASTTPNSPTALLSTFTPTPTRTPTLTSSVIPTRTPISASPTLVASLTNTREPEPSATQAPPTASTLAQAETAQPIEVTPQAYRYVFPVQGAQATYGKYHHDYPAADIFCPIGSLFVAPVDGMIDWVSREDTWDPASDDPVVRGGLSVALIGVDGVRYYGSHLSEVDAAIAPGVQVSAGQTLGKTGKSGDARFTDPHLHFGISRPTTPDDWQTRRGEIAPYLYLQAWERGETLTPQLIP